MSVDVAANVAAVRARIVAAARRVGRAPDSVRLVAAAKSKSAEMVEAAIAAGVTDIGENYVQEAAQKRSQVKGKACWHMIGHLQRNKAAKAAQLFDVVETVDSLELGAALSRSVAARRGQLRTLVEVELGDEASKSGVAAGAVKEIVTRLRELPGLTVDGLMTIPPPGEPESVRPYFRRLREIAAQLDLRELSMGMSDDFEVAIEEGATIIRVGRALFGPRT
jgi:PLP dependent protein